MTQNENLFFQNLVLQIYVNISNKIVLTREDNSRNLRKLLFRKIAPFKVRIKALEKR